MAAVFRRGEEEEEEVIVSQNIYISLSTRVLWSIFKLVSRDFITLFKQPCIMAMANTSDDLIITVYFF